MSSSVNQRRATASASREGQAPPLAVTVPPQTPNNGQQWSQASWDWSMYTYVPQDDGGYWQLYDGIPHSDQLPARIQHAAASLSPVQQSNESRYPCLVTGCFAQPFKRYTDLQKHYAQAHSSIDSAMMMDVDAVNASLAAATGAVGPHGMSPLGLAPGGGGVGGPGGPASSGAPSGAAAAAGGQPGKGNSASTTSTSDKAGGTTSAANMTTKDASAKDAKDAKDGKDKEEMFFCDYAPCPRRDEGFSRKDRFRAHFQDTHKEDVVKKGGKLEDSWLVGRKMSSKWWRCSKCLERIHIEKHGWECPNDKVKCEKKRREFRERLDES